MSDSAKLRIKTYPPSVKISKIGKHLESSSTAAVEIIKVIKEINSTIDETADETERRKFAAWSDKLTNAVMDVASGASSTAAELQGLLEQDDGSEK